MPFHDQGMLGERLQRLLKLPVIADCRRLLKPEGWPLIRGRCRQAVVRSFGDWRWLSADDIRRNLRNRIEVDAIARLSVRFCSSGFGVNIVWLVVRTSGNCTAD